MAQRAGADGSEHGARGASSRPPSAYGHGLPSGARGFEGCGERGTRWDARSQAHGANGAEAWATVVCSAILAGDGETLRSS